MKHLCPIVLLAILANSCGRSLQLVRVGPLDKSSVDRYAYGNPILRSEEAGVSVETNYYDASADYLVFDVQIFNDSDQDLLFDPVLSSLTTETGVFQRAVDPEFQLLSMDWDALSRERTLRTLAWIGAGVLVAGATYAIARGPDATNDFATATTVPGVAAQVTTSVVDAMSFYIFRGDAEARASAQTPLPDPADRYFWLDYSLRLTTIRPGERAVGKLVFARADAARELRVSVGVGEREFSFSFDQRVFRPGRDEFPVRQ